MKDIIDIFLLVMWWMRGDGIGEPKSGINQLPQTSLIGLRLKYRQWRLETPYLAYEISENSEHIVTLLTSAQKKLWSEKFHNFNRIFLQFYSKLKFSVEIVLKVNIENCSRVSRSRHQATGDWRCRPTA